MKTVNRRKLTFRNTAQKNPLSYEEDKSETPWETLCEGMKNTKMNLKRK